MLIQTFTHLFVSSFPLSPSLDCIRTGKAEIMSLLLTSVFLMPRKVPGILHNAGAQWILIELWLSHVKYIIFIAWSERKKYPDVNVLQIYLNDFDY